MSMPLFPIARKVARGLAVLGGLLAASSLPLIAQTEAPGGRPVPGAGDLTFFAAFAADPTVTSGGARDFPFDLSCPDGESTVELGVTVNPAGPVVTVSPKRLSLPGKATVTFATNLATPSGPYLVTLSARVVAGRCLSRSTSFVVEVVRPIRLEVDPPLVRTAAGERANYAVRVRRGGIAGPIELRTSGLPAGFNPVFNPNPAVGNDATLSVTVPNPTNECPPPLGCAFQIRGQAPDGVQVDPAEARVVVERSVRFQANPAASEASPGATVRVQIPIERLGYDGVVGLILVGDPRVQVAIAPGMATVGNLFWLDITLPPDVSGMRYSFTATPDLPPGTVGVATIPADFEIRVPLDFSVSINASPLAQAVVQTQPARLTLEIVRKNVGAVWYLGVNGLPSGARAVPDRVVDPTRIDIFTSPLTPPGVYFLSVQGQYLDPNGLQPLVFSNPVELTVLAGSTPRARLTADPANLTLTSGQAGTSTISVQRDNCNGTVTLTRPATLPPEITDLSFSPAGTDRFTARVVAGNVTAPRSVWLPIGAQVTGCSGVEVQGVMLAVTVQPAAGGTAILSLQPAQVSIPVGGTGTTTVLVTRTGGIGAVGLAVAGLPPGVLATIAPNPVSGSTATLTLTVGANVPAATTPFQVTGSSPGGAVSPASGSLTITTAPTQAPQITSFSPSSGIAGTNVTLTGVNLNGTFDVSFGTLAFGFDSIGFTPISATRVDVLIPAGKPSGFFRLTTPAGTTTSAMAFQVTTPNLPEIGGFDPLSGPAQTRVEIVGSNLGTATSVTFNGTPAIFEPPQANRIFARVPAGATTGQIRVTTPTGTATSFASFAVTSGGAVITGFQPLSGRPGDSVTLAGVNLSGAFAVTFNGIPGEVGIVTANFVQVFVPSGATSGKIELSTPAGPAMTATDFIVLP